MGTTYSILGDSIPVELVIKILSYLSVGDLTSCRLVNRTMDDIIHNSPYIQHQFDIALAGVVDNPSATLSLSERRHALALRRQAWDSYKPQHITTSKAPCVPDFIQNGVYFKRRHPDFQNCVGYRFPPQPGEGFDGPWSYLSPLSKQHAYEIIALAVCLEENDLVAVGIRSVIL
jgi:F-box-like